MKKSISVFTPYIFAAMTVNIGKYIQLPSMLTVAPNGIENDARPGDTPILSEQNFIVKGIVAVLLPIEAGVSANPDSLRRKGSGESFPKNITRSVYPLS